MISALTTRQVADRLGVNVRKVHTLVAQGRLTGAKLIGDGPRSPLFFEPADVERLAAELATEPQDAA